MSKPDDIPQRIWDAADAALMGGPLTHIPTDLWMKQQAIIARAILAAEQGEREACIAAVEAEQLNGDTDDDADRAYMRAINDAITALSNRGEHHD